MKNFLYPLLVLFGVSCMHKFPQDYPKATKTPHTMEKFGDTRVDNYFWLRDRENPQVIDYLTQENKFTEKIMAPSKDLQETIFQEMKGRIKEDDSSYPAKMGDYMYSTRYQIGQQYPLFVRTKIQGGAEEILINEPELSKGHSYYDSTGPRISPNQMMMAYGEDTVGRRFYDIRFKDLKTGKILPNVIEKATGNLVWADDNETVFFAQQNPDTLRSEKIYRYNIKTQKKELVYHEKDETFSCYVLKSLSRKFIYITTQATLTSEVYYLPADKPHDSFKVFAPRHRELEYAVNDDGAQFYITTNKDAKNYRVMTAKPGHTAVADWKELIPHRQDTYISDVTVFKHNLVLDIRRNGLTEIEIRDIHGNNPYVIPFSDQSFMASVGDNREFDTEWLRFEYESMRLPPSVYDISMKSHEQHLRKTREVPGFDPNKYRTERVFITARDGVKVPVSLLMKKDFHADASAPMLVYGYGSYGANMDPWFSSSFYSLIDRGFIFAKAHIRGGSEMGREWYDTGRTKKKMNTFFDFIDVTEGLLKQQYAKKGHVYAMGGSAGGLLVGAVMNLRPDLYNGVVAQVPFVDVITTMLDETIPLTTGEYDEWGNPNEQEAYNYIRTYSPYDNVKDQKYPNVLVTTGLHDSQVQYWEPAKWVSKLRDHNQSDSVILLKTDMEAGHGGASGRFDALKDTALEFAFILQMDSRK
jgi:oligopeptidase B